MDGKKIVHDLGRPIVVTYVEAKEHIDHRVQNKRRVSIDGTASEMSISYGIKFVQEWLKRQPKKFYSSEMKLVDCLLNELMSEVIS